MTLSDLLRGDSSPNACNSFPDMILRIIGEWIALHPISIDMTIIETHTATGMQVTLSARAEHALQSRPDKVQHFRYNVAVTQKTMRTTFDCPHFELFNCNQI